MPTPQSIALRQDLRTQPRKGKANRFMRERALYRSPPITRRAHTAVDSCSQPDRKESLDEL